MASSPAIPRARSAVGQALLTATAGVVCFVLAEWWGLTHANLAVWTSYMVMAQFAFTSFQKGVERVLGRAMGILAGVAAATWFCDSPILGLLLLAPLLTGWFYLYFADRLAYTFLNAGLYAVVLFQIGVVTPNAAPGEGLAMLAAIVLGVAVADGITWLAGVEEDLRINLGNQPLWPIRGDWLSHSLMLVVTVVMTLVGTHLAGLPAQSAAISVMLLIVTPDIQSLLQKGELRVVGAVTATIWSLVMFLIVGFIPTFPVLAALLFVGQFLAAYWAWSGSPTSYAGVQMGLVLPMVVVAPPTEFGSIATSIQRLEGVAIALTASLLVGGLWPRYPLRNQPVR